MVLFGMIVAWLGLPFKGALITLSNLFESFPSIEFQEVIIPHVQCTGNRAISSNDREGFRCNFSVFPFDHNVEFGTFVGRIGCLEGSFVSNDTLELPDLGTIFVLLFDEVENLIVQQHLFILVIIDGAMKLEVGGVLAEYIIMLFNGLNDMCMEVLAIILLIEEKCLSNQIRWVEFG